MKICFNPTCGKEFEPALTRPDQKYCSDRCRAKHGQARKKERLGNDKLIDVPEQQAEKFEHPILSTTKSPKAIKPTAPKQESSFSQLSINDIPFHAAYVIKDLEKKNDDLRDELKKEKDRSEKRLDEVTQLKDEIADMKRQRELDEYKKPGALQGLIESPMMEKVMPHIGPSLGRITEWIADKITNGADQSQAQINGITSEVQDNAVAIINWFGTQPKAVQDNFFIFVDELAKEGRTHEEVAKVILQAYNLLTYQKPSMNANYSAAANY